MTTSEADAIRARRVTAADVARLSGVSRATVSYVLNSVAGQTIPVATQDRVRAAAAELGYVPSAAAASLRRGHSRIVLVVTEAALFGFVTDPFLTAITARLTEGGFVPLTHQFSTEEALRALVGEIRPYGVLALAALSTELKDGFIAAGVQHIYSSGEGDSTYPRPWEEEIGALQANHLIDGGVDMIVYAAPPHPNPRRVMARSREIGVAATCASRGLPEPIHVDVESDLENSMAAIDGVLPRDAVVGVCAFDDEVASIVLASVQRIGFAVPAQVRVIGVDDTPFAAFLTPSLTTVKVDGRQTGREVAERFLDADTRAAVTTRSHAIAAVVARESG
jgi:DNA-binding LacI/PurR family transcriptional regulator